MQKFEGNELHNAVSNGRYEKIKRLLSTGAIHDVNAPGKNEATPLQIAVRKCDLKSTEILLENKADPNYSGNWSPPLFIAMESECPEIIEALLSSGADPNVESDCGAIPLLCAIKWGNPEVVRILLEHGANVDVRPKSFKDVTVLHYAIDNTPDVDLDIVRLLLKHGARVDCPTNCLLNRAAYRGRNDVFELLVEAGAKLHVKGDVECVNQLIRNKNVELLRSILEAGADVRAPGRCADNTLTRPYLHEAAAFGNREMVKVLMLYGADVNERDSRGRTALEAAIGKSNLETSYALLMMYDTDVSDGLALHLATRKGLCEVSAMLLMIGVDVDSMIDGCTPLDYSSAGRCSFEDNVVDANEVLARFGGCYTWVREIREDDLYFEYENVDTVFSYCRSLMKFQAAGLPLSSEQSRVCNVVKDDAFRNRCLDEIKLMKETVLYDAVTIFDFLRATKRSLAVHMHNPRAAENLFAAMKFGRCKIYKLLLWINYIRGIHYKPIYAIAHDNLDKACDRKLPPTVLEKILNYLTVKDLHKLHQIYDFSRARRQFEFHDVFSEIETSIWKMR